MSPVTDWDSLTKDVKDSAPGFEAAPEGNYNLTITKVTSEVAKNSGNQKFSAEMVIDSGPYKGKRVWHDFTVARDNKRALGIFFQNMAVFGMPFDFFTRDTQDDAIIANLVNKRLSADLIVDTYNPEKPKNKISPGWTIKEPKGPPELDATGPSNAGVPGGAPSVAAGPPPANNYQPQQPQQQYNQAPPQQPVYQQPPQQYQEQPQQTNTQQHEDPWQPPSSPPAPPANSNWGAPPPAPPGLQP